MNFYGFEKDESANYQLLCEVEGEQYCGELERPIKHVLLSDCYSIQAIGEPRKQRLQVAQFSDGRQQVIVTLDTLADGAAHITGGSILTVIGTGIAGFFFPPAWGWTVGAVWTGLGAFGTCCVLEAAKDKLHTVKAIDFEVVTVNFGWKSASSPELAGITFTGVVPVSDFNKMLNQFECLRKKRADDDEGFSGDVAMDTP